MPIYEIGSSLWALFTSSFLAATLLPGGSELALVAVLKMHPGQYWLALGVATLGNTLGARGQALAAEQFTWDAVAARMEALYERVASGRRPRC